MRKYFISLLMCSPMAFGCACEPNIMAAFLDVEQTVITENLLPVNKNLKTYITAIKDNTAELKKETPEYKRLAEHEAAVALKLRERLFELKKINALQANKNKILALEIQTILKQNENAVVYEKKLMEKERY